MRGQLRSDWSVTLIYWAGLKKLIMGSRGGFLSPMYQRCIYMEAHQSNSIQFILFLLVTDEDLKAY